ncbi:MAG: hypothetical protein V4850_30485, partial [Myxococcota bacterium]
MQEAGKGIRFPFLPSFIPAFLLFRLRISGEQECRKQGKQEKEGEVPRDPHPPIFMLRRPLLAK